QRRHTAPDTFATKTAGAVWLDKVRATIAENRWTVTDPKAAAPVVLTFGAYAGPWLDGRVLKPSTRYRYVRMLDLRLLPAFGDRALDSITPADVRVWHASWGDT